MTVERKAVEAEVRRLAAEHPTRVYDRGLGRSEAGCSYNPDERNPDGCIIGAALRACGVDTSSLRGTIDQIGFGIFGGTTALSDMSLNRWFDGVQFAQDIGATWGDAVRVTDDALASGEDGVSGHVERALVEQGLIPSPKTTAN